MLDSPHTLLGVHVTFVMALSRHEEFCGSPGVVLGAVGAHVHNVPVREYFVVDVRWEGSLKTRKCLVVSILIFRLRARLRSERVRMRQYVSFSTR